MGVAISRPEYIIQARSPWYDRLAAEIGQLELSLGAKGAKSYRLDLLRRVAGRVDEFSSTCGECEASKKDVAGLVQEVKLDTQTPGRRVPREYKRTLDKTVEHLKKAHKLVDKGYFLSVGTSVGLAVGAGIGAALGGILGDDGAGPAIGPGAGIAIGVAIGAYLENKARNEGRII